MTVNSTEHILCDFKEYINRDTCSQVISSEVNVKKIKKEKKTKT